MSDRAGQDRQQQTEARWATVKTALDLGLQVWRTTEARDRFFEAHDALDDLVRDAARLSGLQDTRVVVAPDATDGGFVASYPEWPGCMSEGETVQDALRNLAEAMDGVAALALNADGAECPHCRENVPRFNASEGAEFETWAHRYGGEPGTIMPCTAALNADGEATGDA